MIRRLRIKGYKSLEDVELTNLGPLVLIFGANATGKSNLLDALDLLARLASEDTLIGAFQKHRGNRLERPLPVRWFFHGDGDLENRKKIEFDLDLSLQKRIASRLNEELEQREEIAELERAYTRVTKLRLRYRLAIEYVPKARTLQVIHESLIPLTKSWEPYSNIVPYIKPIPNKARASVKLERQSHPRLYDLPRSRTLLSEIRDAVNHPHLVATSREIRSFRIYYVEPSQARTAVSDVEAHDPGPNGEQLASFYHWLKRKHQPVFKNLVRNLTQIVSGVESLSVKEGTEGFLELWLEESEGGSFPAALISEGTLRLLCLFGIAATPEPPALVGYEEPENGVNPARLREMLNILENSASQESGSQYLITTHSRDVLNYFTEAQFILCRKEGATTSFLPWEKMPLFFDQEMQETLGSVTDSPSGVGTRFARGDLG